MLYIFVKNRFNRFDSGVFNWTVAAMLRTVNDVKRMKGGDKMTEEINEPKSRQQFVYVKDKAGNEYVCPVNVLKKPEELTEEERSGCIEDASVAQPHAGG